jgi:hypothetical protein
MRATKLIFSVAHEKRMMFARMYPCGKSRRVDVGVFAVNLTAMGLSA